jgi:UDP-glucose 4-epimerase
MSILVTGGAGYIGSHTCVELLNAGYDVVVVDNLSNSKPEALMRLRQITGKSVRFYEMDIRDRSGLSRLFSENRISEVIHFAGLKAVGESVEKPLAYYHNNVCGTLALCETMAKYGVRSMVFSSSATVYGNPASVPIREDFPLSATNPYGRSKLMIEEMLRDLCVSDSGWKVTLLRYFNPVGAHKSGLIGEDPEGVPNNLVPYITQVAVGKLKELKVFGGDYPTTDGTGVRDYMHVVDLAQGHLAALRYMSQQQGVLAMNLGSGRGHSVLEVVKAFEEATGVKIPYKVVERRPGDIAECYADASLARELFGWKTERDLAEMCRDAWHWQQKNPEGYVEE